MAAPPAHDATPAMQVALVLLLRVLVNFVLSATPAVVAGAAVGVVGFATSVAWTVFQRRSPATRADGRVFALSACATGTAIPVTSGLLHACAGGHIAAAHDVVFLLTGVLVCVLEFDVRRGLLLFCGVGSVAVAAVEVAAVAAACRGGGGAPTSTATAAHDAAILTNMAVLALFALALHHARRRGRVLREADDGAGGTAHTFTHTTTTGVLERTGGFLKGDAGGQGAASMPTPAGGGYGSTPPTPLPRPAGAPPPPQPRDDAPSHSTSTTPRRSGSASSTESNWSCRRYAPRAHAPLPHEVTASAAGRTSDDGSTSTDAADRPAVELDAFSFTTTGPCLGEGVDARMTASPVLSDSLLAGQRTAQRVAFVGEVGGAPGRGPSMSAAASPETFPRAGAQGRWGGASPAAAGLQETRLARLESLRAAAAVVGHAALARKMSLLIPERSTATTTTITRRHTHASMGTTGSGDGGGGGGDGGGRGLAAAGDDVTNPLSALAAVALTASLHTGSPGTAGTHRGAAVPANTALDFTRNGGGGGGGGSAAAAMSSSLDSFGFVGAGPGSIEPPPSGPAGSSDHCHHHHYPATNAAGAEKNTSAQLEEGGEVLDPNHGWPKTAGVAASTAPPPSGSITCSVAATQPPQTLPRSLPLRPARGLAVGAGGASAAGAEWIDIDAPLSAAERELMSSSRWTSFCFTTASKGTPRCLTPLHAVLGGGAIATAAGLPSPEGIAAATRPARRVPSHVRAAAAAAAAHTAPPCSAAGAGASPMSPIYRTGGGGGGGGMSSSNHHRTAPARATAGPASRTLREALREAAATEGGAGTATTAQEQAPRTAAGGGRDSPRSVAGSAATGAPTLPRAAGESRASSARSRGGGCAELDALALVDAAAAEGLSLASSWSARRSTCGGHSHTHSLAPSIVGPPAARARGSYISMSSGFDVGRGSCGGGHSDGATDTELACRSDDADQRSFALELRKLWHVFDAEATGYLALADVQCLLEVAGVEVGEVEMDDFLDSVDCGDLCEREVFVIMYEEFRRDGVFDAYYGRIHLAAVASSLAGTAVQQVIIRTLADLEVERWITPANIRDVLGSLSLPSTDDDIAELFAEIAGHKAQAPHAHSTCDDLERVDIVDFVALFNCTHPAVTHTNDFTQRVQDACMVLYNLRAQNGDNGKVVYATEQQLRQTQASEKRLAFAKYDWIVMLCANYSVVRTLYACVFARHADAAAWALLLNQVCDVVFWLWVYTKLRYPEQEKGIGVEMSLEAILRHLRNPKHVLDLLIIIPCDWVGLIMDGRGYDPLLRVNKALLLFYLPTLFGDATRRAPPTTARIGGALYILTVQALILGCFFKLISDHVGDDDVYSTLRISQFSVESPILQFCHSFDYAMKTMTGSVRGSEQTPVNDLQVAYAIVTVLSGVATYAFVLASISNALQIKTSASMFSDRMDEVKSFLSYYNIPEGLRASCVSYYQHIYRTTGTTGSDEMIDDLPHELEVRLHYVQVRDMLAKVPIFADAIVDDGFVYALSLKLRAGVLCPGEVVTEKGGRGSNMYFITHGLCNVVAPNGSVIVGLEKGSFFGEIALLHNVRRTATVVAGSYCNVLVLEKMDFEQVCEHYPGALEKIWEAAFDRIKTIVTDEMRTASASPRHGRRRSSHTAAAFARGLAGDAHAAGVAGGGCAGATTTRTPVLAASKRRVSVRAGTTPTASQQECPSTASTTGSGVPRAAGGGSSPCAEVTDQDIKNWIAVKQAAGRERRSESASPASRGSIGAVSMISSVSHRSCASRASTTANGAVGVRGVGSRVAGWRGSAPHRRPSVDGDPLEGSVRVVGGGGSGGGTTDPTLAQLGIVQHRRAHRALSHDPLAMSYSGGGGGGGGGVLGTSLSCGKSCHSSSGGGGGGGGRARRPRYLSGSEDTTTEDVPAPASLGLTFAPPTNPLVRPPSPPARAQAERYLAGGAGGDTA